MSVYDNMERAVLVVPENLSFFFLEEIYGAVHTQFLLYIYF